MDNKKKFSLGSFLMEHREIPLIAVLILLIIGVNLKIPGYIGSNYMNILKNCTLNLVMAVLGQAYCYGRFDSPDGSAGNVRGRKYSIFTLRRQSCV